MPERGAAGARAAAAGEDLIRPFQIDPCGLRGRLVRLGPLLDRIIARHGYPDAVAAMLGEAVTLAAMLAGALKYDGVFTLQTKADGAIRLLVADITSAGAVRAYAQFDAARLALAAVAPGAPVPRLLGAGYLAFTVDQGEHAERYQGIVALEGARLADCVHHYFRQSEQLEAGIRVAVARLPDGAWRAGGIMIQRLPRQAAPEAEPGGERPSAFTGMAAAEAEDDGWRRALLLLGSCRDDELTDRGLPAEALLLRLFHEDRVSAYPAQRLEDRCRCSRQRIETVLRGLPAGELDALRRDGMAVVTCEFCSTRYEFSAAEVAALELGESGENA